MQTKTRFAPVNGAQIYYEVAGAGRSLILLHAGVADGRLWDDQFAVLAHWLQVKQFCELSSQKLATIHV